jgi:hypothetical protein
MAGDNSGISMVPGRDSNPYGIAPTNFKSVGSGIYLVVADVVFEDGLHSLDVVDVLRQVTGKDHRSAAFPAASGNQRRESVKSPVQRRLPAPLSSAAGALRSSTVQQCVIPDT